jgi:drug/metabolite transporter (DMT)-like permease
VSSTAAAIASGVRLDDERRRGQVATAMAAVAWSTAGILQRELSLDLPTQLAGRAAFAGVALLGFVALVYRGRVVAPFRTMGWAGLAVAVCMAIASGGFIVALNHTTVAHVLFTQAASPMVAALLARIAYGERTSPATTVAMVVSLAGVAVMIGDPRGGAWLGDGASIVMALAFAVAIVITRHRRDVSMAPAVCLAQLLNVLAFAPFASVGQIGPQDALLLAAIGFGQMGLGMALFTVGARLIPAAEAALITLLEVVLAPIWVWIGVGETPGRATLLGGAIVVVAVAGQAVVDARAQPRGEPARARG